MSAVISVSSSLIVESDLSFCDAIFSKYSDSFRKKEAFKESLEIFLYSTSFEKALGKFRQKQWKCYCGNLTNDLAYFRDNIFRFLR